MILLALAFLIVGAYNLWAGEMLPGVIALEIALVLALARFFLGPMQDIPMAARVKRSAGILVLLLIMAYVTRVVFGYL